MYYYTISKEADNIIFKNIEKLLDEKLTDFTKDKLLVDVDGSMFLKYSKQDTTVELSSDFYINAVLVDSTVQLDFLDHIAVISYKE